MAAWRAVERLCFRRDHQGCRYNDAVHTVREIDTLSSSPTKYYKIKNKYLQPLSAINILATQLLAKHHENGFIAFSR